MILNYRVHEQTLEAIPTNSTPRDYSREYLTLHFDFTEDWSQYTKTAFLEYQGYEPTAIIIGDDGLVNVPSFYVQNDHFLVYVVGTYGVNESCPTNVLSVTLAASGDRWTTLAPDPESIPYQQLVALAAGAVKYDREQDLTDGEKAQARDNIDAQNKLTAGTGINISESGEISISGTEPAVAPAIPLAYARPHAVDSDAYEAEGSDLPVVVAADRQRSRHHVGKGRQIVFIPTRENLTNAPTLEINNGDAIQIRQRAPYKQGGTADSPLATIPVLAGDLMRGVPYTMTFCGLYWLVDTAAQTSGEYVTPEMSGAKGDGTTDDTDALRAAMADGRSVLLTQTYLVSGQINVNAANIIGYGATITVDADINRIFNLGATRYISGITFDLAGHGVTQCIYCGASHPISIEDVTIQNIADMRTDKGTNAIYIENSDAVSIRAVTVINCKHIESDGGHDGNGVINGVYLKNYWTASIRDCFFSSIHNVDANDDTVIWDAAAIYLFNSKNASTATVCNIIAGNTGKRFIKTHSRGVIIVNGVEYVNTTKDMSTAASFLPVPGYSGEGTVFVSGCTFKNTYDVPRVSSDDNYGADVHYLIASGGVSLVQIDNCVLDNTNYSLLAASDITVSGSTLIGGVWINAAASVRVDDSTVTASKLLPNALYQHNRIIEIPTNITTGIVSIVFNNCHFVKPSTDVSPSPLNRGTVAFINCYGDGLGALTTNRTSAVAATVRCEELMIDGCRFTGVGSDFISGFYDEVIVRDSEIHSGGNGRIIYFTPINDPNDATTVKRYTKALTLSSVTLEGTVASPSIDGAVVWLRNGDVTVDPPAPVTDPAHQTHVFAENVKFITTNTFSAVLQRGDVTLGDGVDIRKLYTAECNSVTNVPQWVSALPNAQYHKDGTRVLYAADAKLYEALDGAWKDVGVDSTPTASSSNFVTSGGVKTYVDDAISGAIGGSY